MKKTSFIIIALILCALIPSFAKAQDAFPYLSKFDLGSFGEVRAFLKYPKASTIINKEIVGLPTEHPLYNPDYDPEARLIAEVDPGGGMGVQYVIFSWGPSADPNFALVPKSNPQQASLTVAGIELYIPGNGAVYTRGHTNNMYNQRKKFTLKSGKFVEQQQPFYYVGLKTKTTAAFTLYLDKQKSQVVGQIPKDYDIEVLLGNKDDNWLLISTSFGLTAWVEVQNPMDSGIEGIFFNGD